MPTVRLTMAQALVRYLCAQRTILDGKEAPLFGGVFAIFGHGNVTCLGEALEPVQAILPTWRGQNEQSMALAAIAYAKAKRRRQIMAVSSSIGPGSTNMVTAAAVAHVNRLPLFILAGEVFASRFPDPVLQQVEHFNNPSLTVNDAFRAVTRYWDRITRPEQIIHSLPQAIATMLDPADCGPAFLSLCQDVQGEAFDYPESFFRPVTHRILRPRPDRERVLEAASLVRRARKPLLIAGGGAHYSLATEEVAAFAELHNIPVAETIAGRATLRHDHPNNIGPIGVIGSDSANEIAAAADVVLAVGTRLQDMTTGSWSVFANPDLRIVSINAARWDAHKHSALALQGDASAGLRELSEALTGWRGSDQWAEYGRRAYASWNSTIASHTGPTNAPVPSYAQVIAGINRVCGPEDIVVAAAGGLPGELCKVWRAKSSGTFDCEFGYSCMGYEIAGAWGVKMARPDREVIAFVGDGSYLMMNSDIYSSVIAGHKLTIIVCDNGGYAIIDRLQTEFGGKAFNNFLADCRGARFESVDFEKHAASMGAIARTVTSVLELEQAFREAKSNDRTTVIVIKVQGRQWTPGGAWWDIGVPEVSELASVQAARQGHDKERQRQRIGGP